MEKIGVPGGHIAYRTIDLTPPWVEDPQTVIFHHGIGTTSEMWLEWLPRLIGRYRVVLFDFRGFGESSRPGEGFDWTLETFTSDLMAVADASRTDRFHLVGESFGGTVSLHAAATRGKRLISVTCISTPHRGDAVGVIDRWSAYARNGAGMEDWSRELMAARFHPDAVAPDALAWFTEQQARTPKEIVEQVPPLVRSTDLAPLLDGLPTPALLMCGDSSPFVEVEHVSQLHRLLPNSELHVFNHTRHGLAFSHPRECSAIFVAFAERATRDGSHPIND